MKDFHKLFSDLNPWASMCPSDKKLDYYEYIPSHFSMQRMQDCCNLFTKTKRRKPKTFIDLGCGKGGMLYTVLGLGLEPSGVEYSVDLLATATKIQKQNIFPGSDKLNFIHADLFEWVPDKEYDIVYFYRPMSNREVYHRFLARMQVLLPKGQFIISADNTGSEFFKELGMHCYSNILTEGKLTARSRINGLPIIGTQDGNYILYSYRARKYKYLITTSPLTPDSRINDFRATTKPINIEIWKTY